METASLGSRGSRGSLGRKSRKSGQFRKSGKSGKRMAILRIVGNLRNFGNLGKTVLKPAASYDNLARSGFASGWSLKCQRENNSLGGRQKILQCSNWCSIWRDISGTEKWDFFRKPSRPNRLVSFPQVFHLVRHLVRYLSRK